MNRRIAVALLTLVLLGGCGNPAKQQEEPGSFAMNTESESVFEAPNKSEFSPVPTAEAKKVPNKTTEETMPAETSTMEIQRETVQSSAKPAAAAAAAEEVKSISPEVKNVSRVAQNDKEQIVTAKPAAAAVKEVKSSSPERKNEPEKTDEPKEVVPNKAEGMNKISWSQFFDNEDQTTPSEHFWDLSGSEVEINGYMGEVLSFEKNWFLLIPKPGAECPFDNGDETYWNKIMIVFVPDTVNLRHHTGPLKISGKLDVGIKIDESGYKTMFRLYDASFEEIKE